MNQADFQTASNGFKLEADATLGFMQSAYTDAIRGLAAMVGANGVIVSGLTDAGNSVTDGWIWYQGDLVFFQGGVKQANFVITQEVIQSANQSGILYDRYFSKKAKFGNGTNEIPFSSLRRIDSIEEIRSRLLGLYFEDEVILEGCEVSNINGSNLEISAGLALINGRFLSVPEYSGAFPTYFNGAGQWVSSRPANDYITFDPHTSQRLADVFRRAMTPAGDIRLAAALTDNFDSSGMGKWSESGWAQCNGANGTLDMRGYTPIGHDPRTNDPGNNVWDAIYNNVGSAVGEKEHELIMQEMPEHNHTGLTSPSGSGQVDPGEHGLIRRSIIGEDVTTDGADTGSSGTEPTVSGVNSVPVDIPYQGEGQPHENRQPSRIIVYLQRI